MSLAFVQQQQRMKGPPPTPQSIQKMLDENCQLIFTIAEYQKKGEVHEAMQYQQILHRNLIYLATIADSNQNMNQLLPNQSGGQAPLGSQPGPSSAPGQMMPPPPPQAAPQGPQHPHAGGPHPAGQHPHGSGGPHPTHGGPQPHGPGQPPHGPQQPPHGAMGGDQQQQRKGGTSGEQGMQPSMQPGMQVPFRSTGLNTPASQGAYGPPGQYPHPGQPAQGQYPGYQASQGYPQGSGGPGPQPGSYPQYPGYSQGAGQQAQFYQQARPPMRPQGQPTSQPNFSGYQ